MTIDVWYNRNIRLWTAIYKDADSNQIGNAGFGISKKAAIEDLEYQILIGRPRLTINPMSAIMYTYTEKTE